MIRIQRLWTQRSPFGRSNVALRFSVFHRVASIASSCCSHSGTIFFAVRCVQYEQTSATLRGINKKKRAISAPWITKSTKDYMSEADAKATAINPIKEKLLQNSKERKERFVRIAEETDRVFDSEMDRMRDYNVRRWRKGINFFKAQGLGFTLLYIFAYLGCLVALYVGFATGILKKETAYEFMFFFLGGYVDKEWFYMRVEAWGKYVDFGFAFVINEMLELFRFPFMIYTFYTFRPYLTGVNRRVKASIFRWNAAES
ncbi:hypothetical protein TcYC6_0072420 [Trypanosoma cruzi]|uniref:Uncharacterized protein n=2 Tax=Trypanosoma cruzi TaxID=5693 RepID=Q4DV07_TRYCC|nr:hypothetical protein, conserved [Trypanosoma cruzi]EAN96355.1 hypothetical protein, conserved [Trypanosoma cruzi]KAF5224153.1 hypothetical protein ECC02_002739 [Trypanosoma cruzi]KAF8299072.1 hypothetical protein TcYC6_0072420 [Trypanosoma cruzi]RNC52602.1 hypothetical protein TcCL_ESM10144 [Trypanosoma cruzi]|eukprot:XP_818206.1 hypothetical protein [Trypanosoma cruzi strain CL Brener]